MLKELRECLHKKESAVFGGYSKDTYLQEVAKYVVERYRDKKAQKRQERLASSSETKKARLSAFENYTETTSINKCTLCIVAPNAGIIAEVVSRVLNGKSLYSKELLKSSRYSMTGDENDDFILPLKYTEKGGFEETSNLQADIVIATTKAIVTHGDRKIDRKKYFIEKEEDLQDFARKAKNKMKLYAFLSGVDTTIFLDADILQIQNSISLHETIAIVEESQPTAKLQLNLKYISSGLEKKAFIFLANIIAPALVGMISKYTNHKIVAKPVRHAMRIEYNILFKMNRDIDVNTYTEHHINNLRNAYEKVLVVVKDSVELSCLEEAIKNSSPMSVHTIFFVDEYTPKSKIKEALASKKKRVWVITERFIFYRRKRLPRIIAPYNPIKIFSPHVINPRILKMLAKAVGPQETKDSIYASPIMLTVVNEADQYFLSELLGRPVAVDELFAYSDDYLLANAIEE